METLEKERKVKISPDYFLLWQLNTKTTVCVFVYHKRKRPVDDVHSLLCWFHVDDWQDWPEDLFLWRLVIFLNFIICLSLWSICMSIDLSAVSPMFKHASLQQSPRSPRVQDICEHGDVFMPIRISNQAVCSIWVKESGVLVCFILWSLHGCRSFVWFFMYFLIFFNFHVFFLPQNYLHKRVVKFNPRDNRRLHEVCFLVTFPSHHHLTCIIKVQILKIHG